MYQLCDKEEREMVLIYILVCIIVFLIIPRILNLFFICSKISGVSMSPTLKNGDICILKRTRHLKRGDIICFLTDPKNKWKNLFFSRNIPTLIKRIIAIEGDILNIKNNKVYLNGSELRETYLPTKTITSVKYKDISYPLTIPRGYVFVMGDNRSNSKDSRDPQIGLISKNLLLGKLELRIFPVNTFKDFKKEGYYE